MHLPCPPVAARSRNRCTLPRICLLAVLCIIVISQAQAAASKDFITLSGAFLEDAANDYSPASALSALRAGQGQPLIQGRFNQGSNDSLYWFRLSLENSAAEPRELLLDTGVPFRAGLTLYLIKRGPNTEPKSDNIILYTDDGKGFSSRNSSALQLHSGAFMVTGNESVEILGRYRTRGATFMPMTLKTPQQFSRQQSEQSLWSAIFYSTSAILLMVFFVLGAALRNRLILSYAALFSLFLLFIFAVEGYGFKYLWPEMPMWNQYAGLVLLLLAIGLSFEVARSAIEKSDLSPWLNKALIALALLSVILALLSRLLPFTGLVNFSGLLMLLGYMAHIRTIASWMKGAMKPHLISMGTILVALPFVITSVAVTWLNYDVPDLLFLYGTRSIFLLTVATTMASLTIYVVALRREHEQSLQEALAAARRDAELNQALLESEQKYMRAKELAMQSHRQLASTSHDIRQPLTSLRAVINTLGLEKGTRERETLTRALDYIEELSRPGRADGDVYSRLDESPANDTYRADTLLQTLSRMFESEAAENGIELRVVPCSAELNQPPLALVRILSNFTANAIKHCERGAVLLGCRRRGSALRFDVIDTGPGMNATEMELLSKPYEKGESSQGEGLGLAICWRLAAEHGFDLEVESQPGKGSRFSIRLPA